MLLSVSHGSIGIEYGKVFKTVHFREFQSPYVADYEIRYGETLYLSGLKVSVKRIVKHSPDYDVYDIITLRYRGQVKRFKVPAYLE
jgi:hypothetical protein